VVSPVAGVFVDRWDKREDGDDLIRAVLVGILTVLAFLPAGTLNTSLTLALIYLFVFLNAAFARLFMPARFTLLSDIVTGDADRAKASGIAQATEAIAMIIGLPWPRRCCSPSACNGRCCSTHCRLWAHSCSYASSGRRQWSRSLPGRSRPGAGSGRSCARARRTRCTIVRSSR
jgi:hypothetical protein